MRASKFLLLGLLALFSNFSFANSTTFFYDSYSNALSACQSSASSLLSSNNWWSVDCFPKPASNYASVEGEPKGSYYHVHELHKVGCPTGTSPNENGLCVDLPSNEFCQNTEFTAYATIDISSGSAPKSMNYGNCSFSLTYDIQSDDDVANKCRIDNSNSNIIVCPVSAKGTAATSEANTEGFSDIVPVGDYVESKGGDQSITNSQSPITSTADLPEIGDTTNEFTKSEAVTTSRKDEIYNDGDGVKYKSESEYLQINNEMVEEVIKANGDVETTKTETHEKTEQTIDETKIDKDGNVTQE